MKTVRKSQSFLIFQSFFAGGNFISIAKIVDSCEFFYSALMMGMRTDDDLIITIVRKSLNCYLIHENCFEIPTFS